MKAEEFINYFFSRNYFADEQTLRQIIESVGKTAAVAALSAVLSDVILKGMVSAAPTRISVERGIPAELYAIGKNDFPTDVYVTAKRSTVDWRPAIFFGSVFLLCKLLLEYREANVANVTNKH